MTEQEQKAFTAMREALESSAVCIQLMSDGPSRASWGDTLDIIDSALTAANAVSEQLGESRLPERDTSKPAEAQGLFRKFDVTRTDGSSAPGGKHHGCEYFVLDVDHDPHSKAALQAYALACASTHPQLSADLMDRYGVHPQATEPK